MSTVRKIEEAVRKLSPDELAAFCRWFAEYDAKAWDRQLDSDAAGGRFERSADEALKDLRKGRSRDL